MSDYQPTIGLEVHAELTTRTKMFCDSLNDPEERHPNVNVCPVCLGHPGTLPVANRAAVEHVIKTGLALGGAINPVTKFDRKNYFYPDLPKGYQISQYDEPLVRGGMLNGVRVRRIHLEEDTGTLAHGAGASLVDYNRAGVPLMELVTEPDLRSAEETANFARELQLILRYLGVSDADMEKGQMRIEANVSLDMGTYVELKNINSFKAAHDAIEYELVRQCEALERGEAIVKETRGWDEAAQKTVAQRSKEDAHDYRYFPEPDLPPFETAEFDPEKIRATLPELPAAKRARFAVEYGLDARQTELLVGDPPAANYFEAAVSELAERVERAEPAELTGRAGEHAPNASAGVPSSSKKFSTATLFNYLTSDLRGLMNQNMVAFWDMKVLPEHLAHLAALIDAQKITSRQAKDLLATMFATGGDPEEIVKDEGIGIVSDGTEIEAVVLAVIAEHHAAVADYKKGKTASLQFLIGKAMAQLKGRARPDMLRELFERKLGDL